MGKGAPSGAKINKRIEAEPVIVAGRRIQPVARLVGWEMDGDEQTGPFMSRGGRLTPVEVQIESGGEEEVISITDPVQGPLRGIFIVSAAVSAGCILIMVATRVAAGRK